MAKEYIPLFLDFNETTQDLTDEECGRLVRAIIDYANGEDYETKLAGVERIAFRFLKGAVDRNQAISEARAKAGAGKSKTEQTETSRNKPEQTKTKTVTKTKNKNENKNKDEKEKEKKEKPPERFVPPTMDEVAEYCGERHNAVDAQCFVDFYASKGWRVGNQPMRDWKASVRTWEKREQREQRDRPRDKTVIAQQYSQRDYSGMQDMVLERQRREFERLLSAG